MNQVIYSQIASGNTVSSHVALAYVGRAVGLLVSLVTSATVNIEVSHNTTSADFRAIQKPDGSGAWALGTESGAVDLKDVILPFPYFRLVAGVAQTDVSSFAVAVRL